MLVFFTFSSNSSLTVSASPHGIPGNIPSATHDPAAVCILRVESPSRRSNMLRVMSMFCIFSYGIVVYRFLKIPHSFLKVPSPRETCRNSGAVSPKKKQGRQLLLLLALLTSPHLS